MNRIIGNTLCAFAAAFLVASALDAKAQTESSEEAKWYVSAGPGWIQYEGDEAADSGAAVSVHLGYDYNEWWGYEGAIFIAPNLDINSVGNTYIDPETGETVKEQVPLADVDSTTAFGFSLDALFHFTRWDRVDPYLSLGVGAIAYTEDVNDTSFDPSLRVGAGVMYHFNDEWAMRADVRTFFAGKDTSANAFIDVGAVWTWGARVGHSFVAVDGPKDSDGDGQPNYYLDLPGMCWPDQVPSQALGLNPIGKYMGSEEGMGHVYGHWPILYNTGGTFGVAGDYLFRDYAPSGARNGMYGILRVEPGSP